MPNCKTDNVSPIDAIIVGICEPLAQYLQLKSSSPPLNARELLCNSVMKAEEDFNSEVLWCGADVLNEVMAIMTAIHS
jgi:hypothetical protein